MPCRLTIAGVHVQLPWRQSGTGAEKEGAPAEVGEDLSPKAIKGSIPPRLQALAFRGCETAQWLQESTLTQHTCNSHFSINQSTVIVSCDDPLSTGLKSTIPDVDKGWIRRALFTVKDGKNVLNVKQLWYYPPQPHLIPSQLPSCYRYFAHPLLCWMSHRPWKMVIMCPQCGKRELTSTGAYQTVRKVLKLTGVYLLATENLECATCRRSGLAGTETSSPSWTSLTGSNSRPCAPTESGAEGQDDWEEPVTASQEAAGGAPADMKAAVTAPVPPQMMTVPKYYWLQTVYCNDVLSRLDELNLGL
ncbi:hypothetical protein MAR_026727 [Mya arenaria]|uniref:DUF6729 domain-containing protein n=1 Tax=Mya arenaria TaxID=6604 RepID=A0ABY7ERC5_MYAAR|nr:hypothetical protein MAR_026727 [Mya arenaria]